MKRLILLVFFTLAFFCGSANADDMKNMPPAVQWHTIGADENDSMPIGNGDIAVNVWSLRNGYIRLLIAKSDAWSENAQLLKVGRVGIRLEPDPFTDEESFSQTLDPGNASVTIRSSKGELKIWVDANAPVIRVQGRYGQPVKMTVTSELWRNSPTHLTHEDLNKSLFNYWEWRSIPQGIDLLADTVMPQKPNSIGWCHFNSHSMYPVVLEQEHLGHLIDKYPDPLLHHCWGAYIYGQGMTSTDSRTLVSADGTCCPELGILVDSGRCDSSEQWFDSQTRKAADMTGGNEAWEAHCKWWKEFWDRSYIHIWGSRQAQDVATGYAMQRYQMACASRGAYPVKFNGSLFTVGHDIPENIVSTYEDHNPDFRDWGSCYWHQNGRHMYYPLVASGDYDLLKPWFSLYLNSLPLASDKVMSYFGHKGAAWIETMHFWGLPNLMDFGWDNPGNEPQSRYMTWHTQGALEVIVNMLDYYDNTQDHEFLQSKILPFAQAVLEYYNNHWQRAEDGKILFDPTQSIEMYQFDVINDTPTIAGLKCVCERISALKKKYRNPQLDKLVASLQKDVPEIPLGRTQGGKLPLRPESSDPDGKIVILPAYRYGEPSNGENPELYTIFPYRNWCIGKDNLQLAIDSFNARRYPFDNCWGQDGMEAALLGLTDVAKQAAVHAMTTYGEQRFPWFWAKVADYAPDMDNGGTGANTLQLMLMQCDGKKIYLLPAWPADWNAEFKLHAPYNTVVKGTVEDGKLISLEVTPSSRKKDVTVMKKE